MSRRLAFWLSGSAGLLASAIGGLVWASMVRPDPTPARAPTCRVFVVFTPPLSGHLPECHP